MEQQNELDPRIQVKKIILLFDYHMPLFPYMRIELWILFFFERNEQKKIQKQYFVHFLCYRFAGIFICLASFFSQKMEYFH